MFTSSVRQRAVAAVAAVPQAFAQQVVQAVAVVAAVPQAVRVVRAQVQVVQVVQVALQVFAGKRLPGVQGSPLQVL